MSIKKFRKILKNNRGFSLVELIVVIAILGVLSAVAIPQIGDAVTNARIQADRATATQIANAMQIAIAQGNALIATTDQTAANSVTVTGSIFDSTGGTTADTALAPGFLQNLPQSQLNANNFQYSYDGDQIIIWAQDRSGTLRQIFPTFDETNYR